MTEKYKQTAKTKALLAGTDSARKRDFRFSTLTRNQVGTASYWDSGSRDCYTVINMTTGARITPPVGSYPMFQAEYTMQPGDLLVQTGIFLGKPSAAYFHCLPEDENKARMFLGLALKLSGNMVTVEIERETEVLTVDTGARVIA